MSPDLIFNGVQKIPGVADQWVFTDLLSGGTFYTDVGITDEQLWQETERVRERFGLSVNPPDADADYEWVLNGS